MRTPVEHSVPQPGSDGVAADGGETVWVTLDLTVERGEAALHVPFQATLPPAATRTDVVDAVYGLITRLGHDTLAVYERLEQVVGP